jgi:hypothetical protein
MHAPLSPLNSDHLASHIWHENQNIEIKDQKLFPLFALIFFPDLNVIMYSSLNVQYFREFFVRRQFVLQ